jgi:hypothetical protein
MPKLRIPLFLTRVSIVYFLLPWQIMRFVRPEAADGIAKKYYHLPGLSTGIGYAIGTFWMVLLLAFLIGFKKRISYGLVLFLHAGAILVALPFYIPGTDGYNQLFLAAIPAAAAMWLLYLLREQDTFLSLS